MIVPPIFLRRDNLFVSISYESYYVLFHGNAYTWGYINFELHTLVKYAAY